MLLLSFIIMLLIWTCSGQSWFCFLICFDTDSGDDLYRNGALYSVDFLTRTIGDSLDSVDSFWQDLNYGT